MRRFIFSFRSVFIALVVISTIELGCWVFARPEPLAASNLLELAYLKDENSSKLGLFYRLRWAIDLHPDILQIGDSSGLHGSMPNIINQYLGGLNYLNSSFGADPGYLGHYNIAKVVVDHTDSVKAMVFYVTPLAKPAYYGAAGRNLEQSLYSAFLNPWSFLAPPTMAYRTNVTDFIYYGEGNSNYPHGGHAFLGDDNWKESFYKEKGFIPRESAFHIRDPLPLGGCRFSDWFETSAEGDRPFDYFYKGLEKMALLAREKKMRLAIVFNPVPCQEVEESGTLLIKHELARFRKDYPEVAVPFPFITTWPEHLFQDSWHFFSFGAEIASNRLAKEIHKMMDDPSYVGVPPESVETLETRLEHARKYPKWVESCAKEESKNSSAISTSIYTNCLGMRFVTLPPGNFVMGSCSNAKECPPGAIVDPATQRSEKKAHPVTIASAFQIQDAPVTIAQFQTYLDNNYGEHADAHAEVLNIDPRFLEPNAGEDKTRPVAMLSWNDAKSFVTWLNNVKSPSDKGIYRLPTEAEWEYAARSASQTAFWWGNDAGYNMANCVGCNDRFNKVASPIRSFPPNRFGLYDMNGNVWELMQDCYRGWYTKAATDSRAYERTNCEQRSLRGGAADYPFATWSRAASRFMNAPASMAPLVGFRVVRELPADNSFIPVDPLPAKGTAIASSGTSENAFNDDAAVSWNSDTRAANAKAWIGIAFDTAKAVNRIEIEPSADKAQQQNRISVQYSNDDVHWTTITTVNIGLTKPFDVIVLPQATVKALRWRIAADSASSQGWSLHKVRFFTENNGVSKP